MHRGQEWSLALMEQEKSLLLAQKLQDSSPEQRYVNSSVRKPPISHPFRANHSNNYFFLQVVTLFNQGHLGGSLDGLSMKTGLGGVVDGTLREYGTFNEAGLVDMPSSLSWLEASTLSCAALTAWNALYGIKPLQPGDVVLTQGTGGVSVFAVQFAKAAGATVIATTSSAGKADMLKKLGAGMLRNLSFAGHSAN